MWQTGKKIDRSQPIPVEQLTARAAAYCAQSEHAPEEVRLKLRAWGADGEQADLIVAYLEQENYLSEERYVAAFIHDKVRFQRWGRQKIRAALREKRLSSSLIEEALSSMDEDAYAEALDASTREKWHALRAESNPDQRRDKLLRFLVSRGFTVSESLSSYERYMNAT